MSKPTLTQAVFELYDTIDDVPELYNEELPEDAPQLPAAYFLHGGEVAGSYATDTAKPSRVDASFQVILFQTGIVAVEALAKKVIETFMPNSLAIVNGPSVMFRTNYTARGTKLRDKAGNQVHMAQIDYRVIISPVPY